MGKSKSAEKRLVCEDFTFCRYVADSALAAAAIISRLQLIKNVPAAIFYIHKSCKHIYKRKGEPYCLFLKKFINRMCCATPFGNSPHHQTLSATCVTGGKNAGHIGRIAAVISRYAAVRCLRQLEFLKQSLFAAHKAHSQKHQLCRHPHREQGRREM